jgi:hypothetical protein
VDWPTKPAATKQPQTRCPRHSVWSLQIDTRNAEHTELVKAKREPKHRISEISDHLEIGGHFR